MAANLDKSLDDIIKSEPKARRGGASRGGARGGRGSARGGGRGGNQGGRRSDGPNPLNRNRDAEVGADGYGPARRGRRGRGAAGTPYPRPNAPNANYYAAPAAPEGASWKHDLFAQTAAADAKSQAPTNRLDGSSSILVSNLDPEVTAEDVKTIFAARGEVVKAVVNYDKDGVSLGTAEVTFAKVDDAQKAVEEYDGAEVDGRAMYLKVISTLLPPPPKQLVVTPSAARMAQAQAAAAFGGSGFAPAPRAPRQMNVVRGRGGARGGARGGGQPQQKQQPRANSKGPAARNGGDKKPQQKAERGGRGGARGGRGGKGDRGGKPVSSADLDAELDNYHGKKGAAAAAPAASAGQPAAAPAPTPAAATA